VLPSRRPRPPGSRGKDRRRQDARRGPCPGPPIGEPTPTTLIVEYLIRPGYTAQAPSMRHQVEPHPARGGRLAADSRRHRAAAGPGLVTGTKTSPTSTTPWRPLPRRRSGDGRDRRRPAEGHRRDLFAVPDLARTSSSSARSSTPPSPPEPGSTGMARHRRLGGVARVRGLDRPANLVTSIAGQRVAAPVTLAASVTLYGNAAVERVPPNVLATRR
jgi:hypothetical protein